MNNLDFSSEITKKKRLNNFAQIHLIKNGSFYVVYDFEAFLFNKYLFAFNLHLLNNENFGFSKKERKLKLSFKSCSWPTIENRLSQLEWEFNIDTNECIVINAPIKANNSSIEEYENILMESTLNGMDPIWLAELNNEQKSIFDAINRFDLIHSTPMDTMIFLARIKKKLVNNQL